MAATVMASAYPWLPDAQTGYGEADEPLTRDRPGLSAPHEVCETPLDRGEAEADQDADAGRRPGCDPAAGRPHRRAAAERVQAPRGGQGDPRRPRGGALRRRRGAQVLQRGAR